MRIGLYHVNDYNDFKKAPWVQPWIVRKSVNRVEHLFTNGQGALHVPLTNKQDASGVLEKARLTRQTGNADVFEYENGTSNRIHKIEVSEDYTFSQFSTTFITIGYDQYIYVTYNDGGRIWYKQPWGGLNRDRDDTWIRGCNWWFSGENGHSPASGWEPEDYPDEILLLRPKAAGDKDDHDFTYAGLNWHNIGSETAAITGYLVEGTIAMAVGSVIIVAFYYTLLLGVGLLFSPCLLFL